MPNLNFGELVVILMVVMLLFGATRLPQIGDGLGKAIRNFKRGLRTDDDVEISPAERRVEAASSAERVPTSAAREEERVEKKS